MCKEVGITLIEIPYWWDKKLPSLCATIYNSRPDILKTKPTAIPIPSVIPTRKSSVNNNSNNKISISY